MDGRTRVLNAIRGGPLDRIPRFDSFWEDTLSAWRQQGMPADVDTGDYFDWDIRLMHIDASMRCEQKVLKEDGEFIIFQDRAGYTVRKFVGKSRALEWLDHVTRDREAWDRLKKGFEFDAKGSSRVDSKSYFAHMSEYPTWAEAKAMYDNERRTGKCIAFCVYGPFEATWRHRGYAQLLMDLATEPSWVAAMATAQSELVVECLRHCIQSGMSPDALWLIDDVACTRGMLFSPRTWRDVFKPVYRRYGTFLAENGISLWLHCCGNCEPLLPDLIECGVDVLQPLQAKAGMDVRKLKPLYGDDITFWGNIDVTRLSGSEQECEDEIRDKITAAKAGGRYMYHSDHSIPPEVSFERYLRVMELVEEYGRY